MNATGIVRRIDDLGRVVIPKEIRRAMKISEGDPIEIFTTCDNGIYLKKYNPDDETIPEEPVNVIKIEPTEEERKLVCIVSKDNTDHCYYRLTKSQIKFLDTLVNDELIHDYYMITDDIITIP